MVPSIQWLYIHCAYTAVASANQFGDQMTADEPSSAAHDYQVVDQSLYSFS